MAKLALLIGVSEYESNVLPPLPGVVKDIEAMQRVLEHPEIGKFDQVTQLINKDASTIHYEIERLFTENRYKDDLVLLYLSGHGFRDENGYLHYVSCNTKINEHKHVFTGTAVAARFIQEQCMNRSQSQRQVVILDCCFSGAFAEGMSAKNVVRIINIDIAAQLGGEGRAVLTSSTATQVSFEDQGGGVYTQYLIEGMEKGAADTDNDGVITVAELHEYAKRKVQEAKPAMKPEIYAVREGYTIRLANAPVGDPRLEYRKEVEKCVRKDGSFSAVGRRILDRR
ncbi:MAG: caspase family protein [Pelatocladus maniniholoensis HA4357-MV3]|jgi:uncharacterized caspase-like protein|uniref:Caspase family protein n=1 Tax=Pelatocladus maniniholoensis HA4357-MV3 TaxID=1117104 RepID=A0A9E3HBS5_9NOST|nr:caspase family protein [Pelatocladus maniniholoensis HA4357-MV3]